MILSFAECERLFASSSSLLGSIGFFVISLPLGVFPQMQMGNSGGQVQPWQKVAKRCLTSLSSNEWKVMITSLPPTLSASNALSKASDKPPSSLFTWILRAWKLFLHGFFSRRIFCGTDILIISASSEVDSIGLDSRVFTILEAIFFANFYSPYSKRIRTSSPYEYVFTTS